MGRIGARRILKWVVLSAAVLWSPSAWDCCCRCLSFWTPRRSSRRRCSTCRGPPVGSGTWLKSISTGGPRPESASREPPFAFRARWRARSSGCPSPPRSCRCCGATCGLSRVTLVAPDLTFTFAATSAAAAGPSSTFTVSDLRAALAGVSEVKAVDLRSLEFTLERGRVVLALPDQPRLVFSCDQRQGGPALGAPRGRGEQCVRPLAAGGASRSGSTSRASRAASSSSTTALDLAKLLAAAGAEGGVQVQGLVSARVQVAADGTPALRGTFDASADRLSVASGNGQLDLQGLAAGGEVEWTDGGTADRCTRHPCGGAGTASGSGAQLQPGLEPAAPGSKAATRRARDREAGGPAVDDGHAASPAICRG